MAPSIFNLPHLFAAAGLPCAPPGLLIAAQFSFSENYFRILLACGSFLLSGALIGLMVTRWGQARLLSKCAALSLLAHLLIVGYAQIIPIAVNVVVGDGDGEAVPVGIENDGIAAVNPERQPEALEAKPWDLTPPSNETTPAPTEHALERSRVESKAIDRTAVASDPALERALPSELTEQIPLVVPPLALPPARVPDLKPSASVTADAPAAQRQVDTPEVPIGPMPERQRPDVNDLGSRRFATSDTASDVTDLGSRLQTMNEPAVGDSLDALLGPDVPQSALNKGVGTRERNDPRTPRPQGVASAPATAIPIPKRAGDGGAVPDTYRLREHGARERVIGRLGGSKETEAAVALSLQWLARNQSADGRWNAAAHGAGRDTKVDGQDRKGAGADADTAVTALAVLTFLADGQSHLKGDQRVHVQKGLEFLVGSQASDGNLSGGASTFSMMYCHGMATLAVSEAYALTGDKRLKPYVERAIKYTVDAQNTNTGGWRYQPGDEGDMSQFGWQVMALRSASLAGVNVPNSTKLGMQRFLRSCTSGPNSGLASYRPRERATRSMTAEALACRFFLDFDRGERVIDEASQFMLQEAPSASGKSNLYYWYYATLALHQVQDSRWDSWNAALQRRLLDMQIKEGPLAGSYPTDDVWGGHGGSVFTTSLATLCLEVYYRYLPVYAPKK